MAAGAGRIPHQVNAAIWTAPKALSIVTSKTPADYDADISFIPATLALYTPCVLSRSN